MQVLLRKPLGKPRVIELIGFNQVHAIYDSERSAAPLKNAVEQVLKMGCP
jgi:hypothetical protein